VEPVSEAPTVVEPVAAVEAVAEVVAVPTETVVIEQAAVVEAEPVVATVVAEPIEAITEAVVEPVTPAVVAEPIDVTSALADSGLVMVQTTAAPVVVAQAEPPVKLGRPRKQNPVAAQADSESLVMVETSK